MLGGNSFKEAACIPYSTYTYYSIFKLIPWIRFLLFWDDLLLFHLLLQLFYVVFRFCLKKYHNLFNSLVTCIYKRIYSVSINAGLFSFRYFYITSYKVSDCTLRFIRNFYIYINPLTSIQYFVISKYIIYERYVTLSSFRNNKIFQKEFKYQVNHRHIALHFDI